MTFKTILTALALTLLPGLALAVGGGCSSSTQEAMFCAEGSQMDPATGACVPVVSS